MDDFFHRKIIAYQKSKELVKYVYGLLRGYPTEERHALCDQLRRAVISIPSNIAEGMGRFSIKERIHFIEIAYGSLMETMCQLEISQEVGYIEDQQLKRSEELVLEVGRTLSGLRNSLIQKQQNINPRQASR